MSGQDVYDATMHFAVFAFAKCKNTFEKWKSNSENYIFLLLNTKSGLRTKKSDAWHRMLCFCEESDGYLDSFVPINFFSFLLPLLIKQIKIW